MLCAAHERTLSWARTIKRVVSAVRFARIGVLEQRLADTWAIKELISMQLEREYQAPAARAAAAGARKGLA